MATSGTDSDVMSDEIKNINCCLCAEDNKTRAAEKYCQQCKDYFCSSCILLHKKFPSMKKHSVLDKADFRTAGLGGSLPSYPTQRCDQHEMEVVTMFCTEHDDVACAACIALYHRSCKSIIFIPENIDKLHEQTDLNTVQQKISMLVKFMKKTKTSKKIKTQKLKEALDKEIESVKALRNELQILLKTIEQETIKELRKEFDRIETALTEEFNSVQRMVHSLKETASELRKSEGNRAQEYVCIKTAEKVTARAEEVKKSLEQSTQDTVCFIADQNIQASLKQIKTFGKISTNNTTDQQIETLGIGSIIPDHDKECKAKDGLYKVKAQKEIDIKLTNDTQDCKILGSCIMDGKFLLLSDNNNNKLKRMDLSTEMLIDYIDLLASPYVVCAFGTTEAAVTLANSTVQFFTLEEKITANRTLKLDHECFGLVHKDGKIFISDCYMAVYIYNMNGQILQFLQKISEDKSGNWILQGTRHIVITDAGDKVFVANHFKGCVVLDIHGKRLSTMLSNCFGLSTDGENVFACGLNSHSIAQIGKALTILGEFGTVEEPRSMCFDRSKTRVVVTRNGNTITIIELE